MQESELAGLLSLAQREAVADVVNKALLAFAEGPVPNMGHRHATNERAGQARLGLPLPAFPGRTACTTWTLDGDALPAIPATN